MYLCWGMIRGTSGGKGGHGFVSIEGKTDAADDGGKCAVMSKYPVVHTAKNFGLRPRSDASRQLSR